MDTNDEPIPLRKPAPSVIAPVPVPAVSVTPPPTAPQPSKGSWGGLFGIMLIVFLITLAAFYSWGERLAIQSPPSIEAETVE